MFPTLAGGFLTTGLLGKPLFFFFFLIIYLAASDLSWGTSDLRSSFLHVGTSSMTRD